MKSSDRLINGIGLGCASQLFFFLLGAVLIGTSMGRNWPGYFLLGWGLAQWIILTPLIVYERRQGHTRTVQGMVIMGCIGVLLSSACAGVTLMN